MNMALHALKGINRGVALLIAIAFVFMAVVLLAPAHVATTVQAHSNVSMLVGLAAVGVMGTMRSITQDLDSFPARSATTEHSNLVGQFISYFNRNRIIAATAATYPLCAVATVTTKAKTTNATVLLASGAPLALAATDNFWTFTGTNLATGFARKYLLISTAGVASVLASSDQLIAAVVNCEFTGPRVQPDGAVIVGVMTISNASGANYVPGTTALSGVGGLTVTFVDGAADDAALPFGLLGL